MTWFYSQFIYTRDLLRTYGDAYTGIYLALIVSLTLYIIFNCKSHKNGNLVSYLLGIMLLLFFPGLMTSVTSLFWGEDFGIDLFMVFPVILVSTVGLVLIAEYISRREEIANKRKFWWRVVLATLVLTLVEASVPLQLTLRNFVLPDSQGKNHQEVEEISALIRDESVLLPKKLQSAMKVYNWNTNTPLYSRTDTGTAVLGSYRNRTA